MPDKWGEIADDERPLREEPPRPETAVRLFLLLAAVLVIVIAAGGAWFFTARRAMTERRIAVDREREEAQFQQMERDREAKRLGAAEPQAP